MRSLNYLALGLTLALAALFVSAYGPGDRASPHPADCSASVPELPRAEGATRSADDVPALQRELRDERPAVRRVAAEALGRIGPPAKSALGALLVAARDADAGTRQAVAGALAGIDREATSTVAVLAKMLRDPEASVRVAAAQALSRLGRSARPAAQALLRAQEDPDPVVRRVATVALLAIIHADAATWRAGAGGGSAAMIE
jgi:HEAT repeat protein